MQSENDITQALNSRNWGVFQTNSYNRSHVALHGEQRKFIGYILQTKDADVLRGQYNVCIPELTSNTTIKAKLNFDIFRNRPNYTNGTPHRLDVGQFVTLTRFNNSTTYCIDGTFNSSDGSVDTQIKALAGVPESEGDNPPKNENVNSSDSIMRNLLNESAPNPNYGINPPTPFTNASEYDFNHNIDYDTPYSGFLANEEHGYALWVKSASGDKGYARALPGLKISHTWDGSEIEVLPKDKISTASNKLSVINGSDQTKPKLAKSELRRFYNFQKARLLNSNLIFFQFRNGKLVPTRLLAQLTQLGRSAGAGGTVNKILGLVDKISSYVTAAIGIMDAVVSFSEWLNLSFVDKLKDVVSVLGLPSNLTIGGGGIVNASIGLERGKPLSINVRFNTKIPILNVFLEGVANSLIKDFLGSLEIGGIVGEVLSFFGIGGKQKPKEVFTPNQITVGLPPENKPKLKDIINDLSKALPEELGEFVGNFKKYRILGNESDNVQILESTYGISPIFVDYSLLNLDTSTLSGKLSITLIKQGCEYGSYVVQNLIDFKFTNNTVYLFLTIFPFISKSSQIWVMAYINYVLEQEGVKNYLIKEFIFDDTDYECESLQILNLMPTELDILYIYLEEELGVTDYPKFDDIINDPFNTLLTAFEDEPIQHYFEELLNGKIVTFLRGVVLLSSNVDIIDDLAGYKRINEIVEDLF